MAKLSKIYRIRKKNYDNKYKKEFKTFVVTTNRSNFGVEMRKNWIIIIAALFSMTVFAQEDNSKHIVATSSVEDIDDEYVDDGREYLNGMVPVASFDNKTTTADTLHLPTLDYMGRVPGRRYMWYPMMGAFGGWDVHEGLNVNVGLSAFTSFGKHSFNGWGQNLSAIYAKPLNDKWSIAVGAYLNNLSTNYGALRSAGITGVVSYRFNEHWEAYIYGQKAFMDNSSPLLRRYGPYMYGPYGYGYPMFPFYDMGMMGDRIGAGVTWMPNDKFSFSVQFEYDSYPNSFHDRVQEHWEMPSTSR